MAVGQVYVAVVDAICNKCKRVVTIIKVVVETLKRCFLVEQGLLRPVDRTLGSNPEPS
jgi:hypothetical protein